MSDYPDDLPRQIARPLFLGGPAHERSAPYVSSARVLVPVANGAGPGFPVATYERGEDGHYRYVPDAETDD